MYDRLAGKTMMRFAAHAFTILDLFVEIQSSADGKCLPIRERLFTKSSRVYCAKSGDNMDDLPPVLIHMACMLGTRFCD